MNVQSRRYGSAADHRRSLLPHAPYPLSVERSEPLGMSILAGVVFVFGVAMLVFAWGVLA